jgi:hypothetical protein
LTHGPLKGIPIIVKILLLVNSFSGFQDITSKDPSNSKEWSGE